MRLLAPTPFLIAALALCGCNKDDKAATGEAEKPAAAEGAAKAPEKAAEKAPEVKPVGDPNWPGVDLAGELKRLEGKWQVKTGFGKAGADTWEVKGDSVTITKADGTVELGKLKFEMPGRVGVKVGDMTSYYAYARNGETTWIGLGTGGAKAGDTLYVAESRGLVKYDGKACSYLNRKMSFGGPIEFDAPVEVKCEVQEGGGKAVFNYAVPRFMKEGEFDEKSVEIVGEALLNSQLQSGHEVKPAVAAEPTDIDDGEGAPDEVQE